MIENEIGTIFVEDAIRIHRDLGPGRKALIRAEPLRKAWGRKDRQEGQEVKEYGRRPGPAKLI
jgi:hypothetical protein